MELKELQQKSKEMLAAFLEKIGLNGEYYISSEDATIEWASQGFGALGKYFSPSELKADRNGNGLILINQRYKKIEIDKLSSEEVRDLYVTLIHEILHSKRNLLLFDVVRGKKLAERKNEHAYVYNNGRFEQNASKSKVTYVDASQDVLKGNIDTSQNTIEHYKDMKFEEIEDIDFKEGKRDTQMEKQKYIDEALAELMAILSYDTFTNQEKDQPMDIWQNIEKIRDYFKDYDIGIMCEIILKHKDFELFNWMIDPIGYSGGDIHYDFFAKYTRDEQDLVEALYKAAQEYNASTIIDNALDIDEQEESEEQEDYSSDWLDEIFNELKTEEISKEDIRIVATSETAIKELDSSLKEIIEEKDKKRTNEYGRN